MEEELAYYLAEEDEALITPKHVWLFGCGHPIKIKLMFKVKCGRYPNQAVGPSRSSKSKSLPQSFTQIKALATH